MKPDQDAGATATETEGDNMSRDQSTYTLRGTAEQRYQTAATAVRSGLHYVEHRHRTNVALKDQSFMAWIDRRLMELVVTQPSCPGAFVASSGAPRRFEVHHLSGPTTEGRTSLHLWVYAASASQDASLEFTVTAERVAKGVRFARYTDKITGEAYDLPSPGDYKRRGDDDWSIRYADGSQRERADGTLQTLKRFCVDQQEVEAGARPVAINRVTSHAQDLHDRFSNLDI